MRKGMVVCLVQADDKIYLLANEEARCILSFNSVKDGLAYFEDAYNLRHVRSFESSISACLHHITFQPSIVTIQGYNELKEKIVDENNMMGIDLSHVSGFMTVLATRPTAREYWENGRKPGLAQIDKREYERPGIMSLRQNV